MCLAAGIAILSLILLSGCAAQGPPGGGPEDKTGPMLLSSFPENGSVNVSTNVEVVLNFSETIEPRSVESSLQITPIPKQSPIVHSYRRKTTITFIDKLEDNATYIISFGRGIQDYQKNFSEKSVTVAFSTGDSLDEGVISGMVFDIPKKHSVQVWAYRKTDSFPDSILGETPDYKTAVEKNGNYRLTNLAQGTYRLLAVSAESQKIAFVDENCLIGIPFIDPVVVGRRDGIVSNVNLRLNAFYLKPFRLLRADMIEDKVELFFSRNLDPDRSADAKFGIDRDAQIHSAWVGNADAKTMQLNVRGMIPDMIYTVRADTVFDDRGNIIGLNQEAQFTFSESMDTLKPEIVATYPSKNAKNVALNPSIMIRFNEAMKPVIPDTTIRFMTIDSSLIGFSIDWPSSNSMIISPITELETAMEYHIQANCSAWQDEAGNALRDSLFSLSFTTVDANSFGSISGKVSFVDSLVSNLKLSCKPESGKSGPVTVSVPESGEYLVSDLSPGAYRFEIWEDCNNNGRWDHGSLKPFVTAEPYRAYSGKINVRARWETAEVNWNY